MEGKIYKLSFSGPVHFGDGRLSDAEYTCDAATLFSALFIEALAVGCSDDLLQAARQSECMLSDCFPYIGSTLYLPKPRGTFYPDRQKVGGSGGEDDDKATDSRERKAAKRLLYIPAERMADYMNGNINFLSEWQNFKLGQSFLRTKVNLTRNASDNAEPYHVGGYSFSPECGIYFIYQGSYDIEPLLDCLSFSGLGGKRSSGYGAFEYTVENATQIGNFHGPNEKMHMLLSSAAPKEAELTYGLLQNSLYKLDRRGGFVQSATHAASPRKKRDMWVFRPGSLFATSFSGDVFDVNDTPGAHAVYRYARAMWMEV